jgi:SLT domain-containing protein
MVVKIETEGNPGYEVIVNPRENFAAKVAYYDKAYNDDMELIAAKNAGKSVRISDVLMTSNLADLNWFAY